MAPEDIAASVVMRGTIEHYRLAHEPEIRTWLKPI
jgi:hypothetical protein